MKKKRSKIAALASLLKKIPRGMTLTFLILFVFLMRVSADSFSQQLKVSLDCQDEVLSKVFKSLEKQTNLFFFFNDKVVDVEQKVSVSVKSVDLDLVLEKILGNRYNWEIVNNLIVIKAKSEVPQAKKSIKIVGKVVDEDKVPLPGVTIRVKDTRLGVATDQNGLYSLMLPEMESIVLMFSFVGMDSQEVKYTGQDSINVVLKATKVKMEEIVITGYANIRKESFTGNAIMVTKDQLMKTNSKSVLAALQAFDPSFRIAENSIWGSDPNSLPELNIRGASSIGMGKSLDIENAKQTQRTNLKDNPNLPIFILDGFEVDVEKIYDMDMNRIANMTILKDAAATAVYGSRAANGVVVVTTVTPKPGEMRVSYSMNGSVEFPDLSDYNLCNAAEKLEVERLMGLYTSSEPQYQIGKDQAYYKKLRDVEKGIDTDWLAQPLHNVFNHKHSLTLDGGSEFVRYGVNLSYDKNGGAMKGSFRNRMGVGVTMDVRNKRWLQIMNSATYDLTKSENSPYGSFSQYTGLQPYEALYDDAGNLVEKLSNKTNPLWSVKNLESFDGRGNSRNVTNNLNVNILFLEGFQFKGQLSVSKKDSKSESFVDPKDERFVTIKEDERGSLTRTTTDGFNWNINAMFYYNKSFGKHFINATAGMNMKSDYSESTSMTLEGFPLGDFNNAAYAASQKKKTNISSQETRLVGFLAMLNYSYNDIYLLDGSLRVDGSSQFGADRRYAPFWATGAGINIHNFSWMKDNWLVNKLKIRASYGSTGKVNFPPSAVINTLQANTESWYYTGPAMNLKYLGNPKLTWETTKALDAGLSIGLLNDRFFVEATYYHKKTINSVDNVSIQTSSGFSERRANGGTVLNEGFEINCNSTVYRDKDLNIVLNANLASNKNKVLSLGESSKKYNQSLIDFYNGLVKPSYYYQMRTVPFTQYKEGASTTAIYAVRSAGIDPSNGREKFIKQDGTSTYSWDANDQVVVGDNLPQAQGGFGINVGYRGFYLNASFLYQWGAQTYNSTLVNKVENADIQNSNVDKRVLSQRWKNVGDIAPYYDMESRLKPQPTSRFVQDYNYLNFSGLSFGYDFDRELIRKIRLTSLGVRMNATDLCRWSSVKEERGTSYPYAKNYSFSINVGF